MTNQPNRYYDQMCESLARDLKLAFRDIDWYVLKSVDLMMHGRDEYTSGRTIIVQAQQHMVGIEIPVSLALVEHEPYKAVGFVGAYVKESIQRFRQKHV